MECLPATPRELNSRGVHLPHIRAHNTTQPPNRFIPTSISLFSNAQISSFPSLRIFFIKKPTKDISHHLLFNSIRLMNPLNISMDQNLKSFPILSYVMERLNPSRSSSDGIEQQQQVRSQRPEFDVLEHVPHLIYPSVLPAMKAAVSEVAHTRSVLQTLEDSPDHEAVDIAQARMAQIDDALYRNVEDIHRTQRPSGVDVVSWRTTLEDREECKAKAEKVKTPYRAVIELDEMHEAYQSLLKEAEKLMRIYDGHDPHLDEGTTSSARGYLEAVCDFRAATSREMNSHDVLAKTSQEFNSREVC